MQEWEQPWIERALPRRVVSSLWAAKEGEEMCDARLLSVKQASLRLNMSRSATYRLIQAGSLRSVKIFAARRVPVEAIDELIRHLEQEAADDVSDE